jgi:predicted Zn-dependent protease
MSVRWKPLIILSGFFLVVAAGGLIAFMFAMRPGKASEILPLARKEADAGQYERSFIQYRRALQREPRNAAIHEELAGMIDRWLQAEPGEHQRLRPMRLRALADAARYGPGRPAPVRALLADALEHADHGSALIYAQALLPMEPNHPDALGLLVTESLDRQPPAVSEAQNRLAELEALDATSARTIWARAQIARAQGDTAALETILVTLAPAAPPEASIAERMARLRLRGLAVERATSTTTLVPRLEAVQAEAEGLAAVSGSSAGRLRLIARILESSRRHAESLARHQANAEEKQLIQARLDATNTLAESVYVKAIEQGGSTDLGTHLAYAEHLLNRGNLKKSLEAASVGLKMPISNLPAWHRETAALREVAVKAILADTQDPDRFTKATPFVADLIASTNPLYSGLGHLFQGLMDLERSGLSVASATENANGAGGTDIPGDARLRGSARDHLRQAAESLPDSPTAQALYGVSLVLTREAAIGRQYLQKALAQGQGRLEPRYQLWVAWSVLQAGYPEAAEPILAGLLEGIERGVVARELEPTVYLLQGEMHQSRRTADSLRAALAAYEKALAAGHPRNAPLELKIAQIEIALGRTAEGQSRMQAIEKEAGSDVSLELHAIVQLRQKGDHAGAQTRLSSARSHFPASEELVALDAAMLLDDGKPEKADGVLAEFLETHPEALDVVVLRSRILAGPLKNPDAARKLLLTAAEQTDSSLPHVQLVLLEMGQNQLDAAEQAVTTLRQRWNGAAAVDLLEAQIKLARGDVRSAERLLSEALDKDPNNKIALFWKARLAEETGKSDDAAQIYHQLTRNPSIKEVDDGLTVTAAAQWALASQALARHQFDQAIQQFRSIVRDAPAELGRAARWRLATALAEKGDPAASIREIQELVAAQETTPEERVEAATLMRKLKKPAEAITLVEKALAEEPGLESALALRAALHLDQGQMPQAAALLRQAIDRGTKTPSLYLFLAAIEQQLGPAGTATDRALAVLNQGIEQNPDSFELIRDRYRAMRFARDPRALEVLERTVASSPKPDLKWLLVEIYREEKQWDQAEVLVRKLHEDAPKEPRLALTLIGIVAAKANAAARQGDVAAESRLNAECKELIQGFRQDFPDDPAFLQAEAELAERVGDRSRAHALAAELTEKYPTSASGPILQARFAQHEGKPEEVAHAYEQALEREPARQDIRLALAQNRLAQGQVDHAVRLASAAVQADPDRPEAILLEAQSLAARDGSPSEVKSNRENAIRKLRQALEKAPNWSVGYHLIAQIEMLNSERSRAIATLKNALKLKPADDTAIEMLVQILAEPQGNGRSPDPRDLEQARAVAQQYGERDTAGAISLALAVGFHKAGQPDLALPWAEKACRLLDRPMVRLTLGDILLAKAEADPASASSREWFRRAMEQYDAVLKANARSVEAVNNKAWILSTHFGQHDEALELIQSFQKQRDSMTLPPELFDTEGVIHEALGRTAEAEQAYATGLARAPEHPVLNFHMARLLASDTTRLSVAEPFLKKAEAAAAEGLLDQGMATELRSISARIQAR